MSTHKHIDKICCAALALVLILTLGFINAEKIGVQTAASSMGYENRLFLTSRVHTIDIVMEDWESFLDTCESEEYSMCSVVIDNESYKNVGIRAKGNTSLSSVAAYGNDRYSFKIEFDHYDSTKTYYGLDKISLNNLIQDNTYLKNYLCYQMMEYFGVASPLCSFVYVIVNGEDWGLYLAVESVEESFLQRNGMQSGELYKPDSMQMAGGRGNGRQIRMDEEEELGQADGEFSTGPESVGNAAGWDGGSRPGNGMLPQSEAPTKLGTAPDGQTPSDEGTDEGHESASEATAPGKPTGENPGGMGNMGGGMSMGSDDVSLIYTDNAYESYRNIFDNAKTELTDADKDRLIASLKQLNENQYVEEVVDVEQVIRYFVVHNFVCNFDSYTGSIIHNYYLYEEDGALSMIPWDYNLAFGGFQSGGDATSLVNYPIDTPVSGGTVQSRPMLAWILENEAYTELYHQYFAEFLSAYFDSGYFEDTVDSVSKMISPYLEKDPTKFCTYEEFKEGITTLKEFCTLRAESIHGQLDGSIPSTSDGQNQDGSTLIDASSLTVSTMGSMGNNHGQGDNREIPANDQGDFPAGVNGTFQTPDSNRQAEGNPSPDGQINPYTADPTGLNSEVSNTTQTESTAPSSGQGSLDGSNPPTDPNQGGAANQMPGGMQWPEGDAGSNPPTNEGRENQPEKSFSEIQTQSGIGDWILLGVSVLVLAFGLFFAFRFKRK